MDALLPPSPFRRQLALVVRSACQAHRNPGTAWLFIALIGFMALLCGVVAMAMPHGRAAHPVAVIGTVMASVIALLAWSMLAFNVLQQNHPHWIALLPGHARMLRTVLIGSALAVSAACGLLGMLAGWPFAMTALTVAAIAAAAAIGMRWPWLWLLDAVVLWAIFATLNGGLPAPLAGLLQRAPLAVVGAVLAAVVLALRATVFTGGRAHARLHERLQARGTGLRGFVVPSGLRPDSTSGWWKLCGRRVYDAWLRRTLTRADSTIGARLALGAGAQAHWTGTLTNVAFGMAILLPALVVLELAPAWQIGRGMRTGLLMGIAFSSLTVSVQLAPALWASRREQALLMLLPGVPRGPALNRWLGGRLVCLQLTVTACQLTILWLVERALPPADNDLEQAMAFALGTIAVGPLLILWLWRDWSRARAPSGKLYSGAFGATLTASGIAAAWVFLLQRPWYELAIVIVLVLLPLAWWRWRSLSRWPAAWPVGRLE